MIFFAFVKLVTQRLFSLVECVKGTANLVWVIRIELLLLVGSDVYEAVVPATVQVLVVGDLDGV